MTTTVPVSSLVLPTVPKTKVLTCEPGPRATSTALPMALDCTPGSRNPQESRVTRAKIQAYHFWPMAFSM